MIGNTGIMANGKAGVMDAAPVIVDDRMNLLVRYVVEALGYAVGWSQTAQTVSIKQ